MPPVVAPAGNASNNTNNHPRTSFFTFASLSPARDQRAGLPPQSWFCRRTSYKRDGTSTLRFGCELGATDDPLQRLDADGSLPVR